MDLDAFFASCEQRDQPAYRGRPVVVGARPGHRGVVAAASYEARRYGIHSAMPIAEAHRRCPAAVYLRPDMAKYKQASREVFAVLETLAPEVEAASIDEAYLDVSGLERLLGPPETIGREIKRRILDATGLTASVGIGPNRLIAKLGSEHRKPDGLTVVYPDQVSDFLAPLPVACLRGLGRQTQKVIDRLGIRTVGQLRDMPLAVLEQHLGKRAAASFHNQSLGMASDRVVPHRGRKSISKETTFEKDVTEASVLNDTLRVLSADVARTARREGLAGAVVTLKIRFAGFETHTRQRKQAAPTDDERGIHRTAWQLFLDSHLPKKPVRLIGVGISGWTEEPSVQTDLFRESGAHTPDRRVLETIDAVEDKFGRGLLQVGLSRKRKM